MHIVIKGLYKRLEQKYRILSPFHIHTLSELLTNGLGVSPERNRSSPDSLHPRPQLLPPTSAFININYLHLWLFVFLGSSVHD